MKAIRVHDFGPPESMILEEVPDPVAGPGEAVVAVKAAGVNPVDTYIRTGQYAHLPELPYTPGGDAAGVVESLGEGVTDIGVGQRVYLAGAIGGRMSGCYADKVVRPASELLPLPASVGFGQGAALGVPCATAYYALDRGRWAPGETVFVHGASGAVGIAAVQLARAHGMRVIGSAGSEAGRRLVLDNGAHAVVDHTAAGYMAELGRLTAGAGPNLILEMLANVNLQADLDAAARYGRVVVIGNRGTIEINPRVTMMKDLDVMGVALWNCAPERLRAIHGALVAALEVGALRPHVGREMALGDAAAAHEKVMAAGAQGKIVLLP